MFGFKETARKSGVSFLGGGGFLRLCRKGKKK
jgi:hypothetical protein